MSRRRLRVVSSSDEDDDGQPPPPDHQHQQHQQEDMQDIIIDDIDIDFQTVTLNSSNPTPNSHNSAATPRPFGSDRRGPERIPIDVSDEGEDNFVHIDSVDNSNSDNANGSSRCFQVSASPVNEVLETLGLRLRREWLESCLRGLQSSTPGFQWMDDSAKAQLCFAQFLSADMNYCGAGLLPPNVHSFHLVDLRGPFILQVDEIVNISCPLRGRYQNAALGAKRCLKLCMTDGVQRVFGMEYRPIKDLEALAPAGLKVAVCNVNIRRGLLMLVPEVIQVLGGSVEELEAARLRLVNEVNKPPRGKRNRTGGVLPLATRATAAAWPQHSDAPQNVAQTTRANTAPVQDSNQGIPVSIPSNDMHGDPSATIHRNHAEPRFSTLTQSQEHEEGQTHTDLLATRPLQVSATGTLFGSAANASSRDDMGIPVSTAKRNHREDLGISVSSAIAEPSASSVGQLPDLDTVPRHVDELMTDVSTSSIVTGQVTPDVSINSVPGDVMVPVRRDNVGANTSSAIYRDAEDTSMVDELEHHFILSKDNEIPFTYLDSLSKRFAAVEDETTVIRGKIKCFLTGVKGFQYKKSTKYDLRVYVDDGSLIFEILIDHNVVEKRIGYSPQEVTAALACSESKRVSDMKEIMKHFQTFLINFEGIMVVELSKASPVPVAVEMRQGWGCHAAAASDAWLLLERLKSYTSGGAQQTSLSNPIDLSP